MFYQYWAFAGQAEVSSAYYPGLTPLNPDALAAYLPLAYEQWVKANPGKEVGGFVYMDTRAGVYDAPASTRQEPGENGWGADPDPHDQPDYGDFKGGWHSQVGGTFNEGDAAVPGFTAWVGTDTGTVFRNSGGITCVLTGPTLGYYLGQPIQYSTCR